MDRSYFGAVERGQRNIAFLVLYRLCLALAATLRLLPKKCRRNPG